MQCLILAGGLGTRMLPFTETVPKTLLPVLGRPFADLQLGWLREQGVTDVVYSVGHLGSMVRDHVGDGSSYDLRVTYVDEGPRLRGTGGALRLALDTGALQEQVAVLYGDSWLTVDVCATHSALVSSGCPALMTVLANEGRWDASNVVLDGDRVVRYGKGLSPAPAEMRWIDYGLLWFTRDLLAQRIPRDDVVDLAPVLTAVAADGQLTGFEVTERFYEIGSPQGLADLEAHLTASGR